ncbi:hypothetical protein J2T60_000479 [Natronospira proteinivora]|uniref:Uncharacterized protein n=1 Tax=Natronospira proteinivora TaxID=1807133 RepID=A0ABT1G5D0_9GAMM|nr:hypothetical protein [Natronospira proteinivora]MCP1726514.1 hypothetical protein [Natronospira proteinivora]
MRPLAVLTGIILGSCFSIFVGLLVVVLLYWLNAEYDYISRDIPLLLGHSGIFFGLTLLAAAGLWSQVKDSAWRWYAQAALWAALAATVVYYWPD